MAKRTRKGDDDKPSRAIEPVPHLTIAELQDQDDSAEGASQELFEYMTSVLMNPRALRGKKGGVQLRQINGANLAGDVLGEWALDSEMADTEVAALARQIAAYAEAEARGIGGGTWAFGLFAHVDGAKNSIARRRFLIHVPDMADGGQMLGGEGERAVTSNAVAFVGQNQRHIEQLFKQLTLSNQVLVGSITTLVQQGAAREQHLETTHMEALRVIRDAADNRAQHDLDRMREEARLKRSESYNAKFLELLPFLLAAVGSKLGLTPAGDDGPAPAASGPSPEAVAEMVKASGIDPNQLIQLLQAQAQGAVTPP